MSLSLGFKQRLLGNPVGQFALALRERFDLFRTAYTAPSEVGTLANDQLATRLITRLCDAEATFVDVGAHIGSIVAEVSREDPTIRIVAIEAIPDKVEALRRKFPSAEIHQCAVGDTDGEVPFFIDTKRSGYSSLRQPNKQDDALTEVRVPMRRLDDLISNSDPVNAIKIDVEGAELGVLRGAQQLLERCRPTILFESGPGADDGLGFTKEDLFEFFHARDYQVVVPNRLAHHDDGLTRDGFVESHLYPRRTTNYFAVPREKRDELRERARRILNLKIG